MKGRQEFFFLREKPAMALLAIRDLDPAYASAVAKRIDSTVPHTLKIIAEMEERGLVTSKLEGRIRRIELTEHGQAAAAAVSNLIDALGEGAGEGLGSESRAGSKARGPLWTRLARLEEAVRKGEAFPQAEAELLLGPLRRDLARLKRKGAEDGDEEVRSAAEALDDSVLKVIGNRGGS